MKPPFYTSKVAELMFKLSKKDKEYFRNKTYFCEAQVQILKNIHGAKRYYINLAINSDSKLFEKDIGLAKDFGVSQGLLDLLIKARKKNCSMVFVLDHEYKILSAKEWYSTHAHT